MSRLVGKGLSIFATVICMFTLISPGWTKVGSLGFGGLFYGCVTGFGCVVYEGRYFTIASKAVLPILIIAECLLLVGAGLLICGSRNSPSQLRTAANSNMCGGFLALVAVATFTGIVFGGTPNDPGLHSGLLKMLFYSYWCTWVGGLMAYIGGVLLYRSVQEPSPTTVQHETVVMHITGTNSNKQI